MNSINKKGDNNEQMEEYIELCHYQTQEKVTVKAKRAGKEGQYLAHCINPDHEDVHPSMGINLITGEYNCISRHDAKGVTWARHLRESDNSRSYKQKSNKKYLQEKKDSEIKSEILMAIDTDINNWEGYFPEIKEEVRIRLPYDLCFLPPDERTIAMGTITKAGIFRMSELKSRVKKVKYLLEKQKKSVKEEGKKKEPELKTFLPGLIHLVDDDGVKKYLLKNEDNKLSVVEAWINEGGQIFKPRQDLPIGYASMAVFSINEEIRWNSLLKDIEKYIKKHLELSDKIYYLIFGLWIMHTYLMEKTNITPYLYFTGLKATGKSRAGQIAQKLAYKCFLETYPTPPVLFRTSDLFENALVIDEAKFWGSNMDIDLARIVMSKYKRGVVVPRINLDKKGERQVELHNVFSPFVICTESNIPEPIEDRCVKFQMQQNKSPSVEDDWDLTEEQNLRDLLTLFRARFYNEELPQHKRIARRRLGEILSPLYKILLLTDESRTEEFKKFIKKIETSRTAEEATSEDATIARIIIDFYNEGSDFILTQEVRKRYNLDIDNPNFQISDRKMGWRLKPFNFEKKPMHSRAGWMIDRKTLAELAERFSIDTKIIPVDEHIKKVQEQIQLDIPD